MNITFICGSLEPGKDGVGDYVRCLSSYLAMHNHVISIISINDRHASNVIYENQIIGDKQISVTRLPTSLKWKERLVILKTEILKTKPTWVSLQYVPYSFNKWGVPILLGNWLKQVASNTQWHLMVHEPYLGDRQTTFKLKLIKYSQQLALRSLYKNIKPSYIHTSIPRYQSLLSKIGIKSTILGLFGNIPIEQVQQETKQYIGLGSINAVYFGTAPALANQEVFAHAIRSFSVEQQKKLNLTLAGRLGSNGQKFIEIINKICGDEHCEIKVSGALEPPALSQLFLTADIGIARVPPLFLGKSGTVISMLEHGLPVWVVLGNDQSIEKNLDFRPELCCHDLPKLLKIHERPAAISRLPLIAEKMISDFSS